ncbi:hypothetical protein [Allopontixanthobacter sp.]|uniref:hypothetical protein n=1 Tax=Allopontixanthobacter sp. TaxID=2906452 RepID=UPI002AB99CFC|nr:hypothetical protein [Allopontixanthobacter sp.]MDZ4306417.1 hypothetical protein [Allopontixanthobacter sp.]
MTPNRPFLLTVLPVAGAAAMLAGCAREGELVIDQGVGISAIRSVCPAVGVPDFTGDITTFRTAGDRTAANMDVTASITNVRTSCNDTGEKVYSEATFDVLARRTGTAGARRVELPYYSAVLRGGSAVQAKRIGTVVINFADGQERAQASAKAGAFVDRAEATLPPEIREQITRRRRAGDVDAALDPLADPQVKAALARATFELLIGFQLTEEQLAYNATR